jgi:acetyl esterase
MDTNPLRLPARARVRLGGLLADGFFRGASRLGRALPIASPERYGVERIRDIPYQDTGLKRHLLDVYRPQRREGLSPIVIYIHGGGFRLCSKDSHWLPGVLFAQAGYTVVNINYRLAPKHRFPDALIDCTKALQWVMKHGESFGGDPSRLAFAGESAGGNLATALTICTLFERPEPYAQEVWKLNVVPKAVLPAAGILQVSDSDRFRRDHGANWFFNDRITSVCKGYYQNQAGFSPTLADPLLILEESSSPSRTLPPFCSVTSTGDPIISDSLRLQAAVEKMGGTCELLQYEKEMHAFHLFYFRSKAKDSWQKMLAFITAQLPPSAL